MVRQRQLTIPQSIRVGKVWMSLLRVNGDRILWDFWGANPNLIEQLCVEHNIEELIEWPAPYARSWANLKLFLKAVGSYMSRGNFEAGLNQWVNRPLVPVEAGDEPGGGLAAERASLIQLTPGCEDSTVGAMTSRSREMLLALDYCDAKFILGEAFVGMYNTYNELRTGTMGLENRVLREERTKADALEDVNGVFNAQQGAFESIKAFFTKEPGEGAFNGTVFLFGDNFYDGVTIADLDALVNEAGGRQNDTLLRAAPIEVMGDVPELLIQHDQLILLYNAVSNQRVEREEQSRDVNRRTRILMLELNAVRREMEGTEENDFSLSVIKDYLEQISDLKKKLGGIRSLVDYEIPLLPVRATEYDRDGVAMEMVYTVDQWLTRTRRRMLLMKDEEDLGRRKKENREKMMVQETLKSIPRNKLVPLDSRRVFLPWQTSYEALKNSIKNAGVRDWRQQVLKIAKDSLKLKQDSDACLYLTELREFETYIQNEYVIGVNMVTDLFSNLFSQTRAKDIVDSIRMITEALNILRTIKSKKLWVKFTEEMLEKIVQRCLLRKDGGDFTAEWAKERARAMMAIEVPEESEEDETGIDLNRTIADEITKGSLDAKKDFLVKFLKTKLLELGQKQATARTLGEDKSPERRKKSVKFRRGDKVFRMREVEPGEDSSDEDEVGTLTDNFETLFIMNEDDRPKKMKKKTNSAAKKCPIRCPKTEHVNGSLYFCNVFRRKEKEEMRAIIKKLYLCLKCLGPPGKDHQCPVGKCKRCGGAHNILLCTKEAEEEKSMIGKEKDETSEDDSEDQAYDDFTNNRDNVNLARNKTEAKKDKPPPKEEKKGKGQGDEEIVPESAENEKKKRLAKLREVLANIAADYEKGKEESIKKSKQSSIMMMQERVCLVKTKEMDSESGSDESQEYEEGSSDSKSGDSNEESGGDESQEYEEGSSDSKSGDSNEESGGDESQEVEITEGKIGTLNKDSSESTRDQEGKDWLPKEVKIDQCTLSDSEQDENEIKKDEETSSEEWTNSDSDGSGYEKTYFISSAANIRRREIHGQPRYTEETSVRGKKRKLKKIKERLDQASLKDLQAEVLNGTTQDDRGLKLKNQKRSVNSIEKWAASDVWEEIIAEGEERVSDMVEAVHLLHIPNTTPVEVKEPEPPPGYRRTRYEPKTGGKIFKALLNLSTQLFERVVLKGKNLASMTTPLTVCGDDEGEIDFTTAAINGIEVHVANGMNLLQTCGITDTGADTNCTDRTLRKIIGRDPLPDALVGIQGSTGTSNDKSKDRLRLVSSNNEISVMESRSIDDLGYSGPNSAEFLASVRVELDVKDENECRFDLNTQGAVPRVLIGLKSGELLASQLTEVERLELNLDEAFLSPNMQIWSTPLNSKLLITGSLGVDPNLIELKNNYPRFKILAKNSESEEDILERIKRKKEELERIFKEEFDTDSDKLLLSLDESEKRSNKAKVNISADSQPGNETESSDSYESVNKLSEENWQAGTEAAESRSDETNEGREENCPECIITDENFSFSQGIQVQCSSDKILVLEEEILVLPSDYKGDIEEWVQDAIINKKPERVHYTKSDSQRLEKFLLEEQRSIWGRPKKKCRLHSQRCDTCDLLSRSTSRRENQLIKDSWDAVTSKEVAPGRHVITHAYQYRHDPLKTYEASKSNIVDAKGHSRKVIRRAHKQGSLPLLQQQVDKMLEKRCFRELSKEEITQLETNAHNFTYFNWVTNPTSASTPFRMISNTSAVSNCTTISTEQLSPTNVLNPQENSLIRFSLFPVPLCADIQGAYHTVLVDEISSFLRLFFFFWDPPRCEQPRIFAQTSQSFGDGSAAQGLEIAILKFVVAIAVYLVSKYILESIRYSDNILYSFKTLKEYKDVKQDLEKSLSTYSMNLKYCITSQEFDKNVLKHPKRGAEVIEKMMGIRWSVEEDTITAIPNYNLHGTSRGKALGPPLKNMTDQEIQDLPITRMTFLRLSAQCYCKLANLLGPLMFATKVLTSRACEIATVDELNLDLQERDSEFVALCKEFISNLRRVEEIIPFKRCWIPTGYSLIGFVVSLDGGRPGMGCTVHSLAEKDSEEGTDDANTRREPRKIIKMESEEMTEEPNLFFSGLVEEGLADGDREDDASQLESGEEHKPEDLFPSGPQGGSKEEDEKEDNEILRSLALTRSKIAKRNIVSHEALAGKLSAEALSCVLEPLVFDHHNEALLLPFKTDSTCCLAMLNPAIDMKNMLLSNAVSAFKDELIKISIQFPKSLITVGHVGGISNPSDVLTKLYRDPIKAINSQLYREGPPIYGSRKGLCQDVVVTCQNGEMKYLGLPKKFLTEKAQSPDEKCTYCFEDQERCALARTRAQDKREKEEDAKEVKTEQENTVNKMEEEQKVGRIKRKMIDWLDEFKGRVQLDSNSHNLLDPHQECRLSLVLTEEKYMEWISKFFSLQEMFRAACMLAALELTRLKMRYDLMNVKKEAQGIIIRTGQKYFNKGIQKMSDSNVSGIRTMSLRLQSHKAMEIYGTRFLPILGSNDPLIRKVIRNGHELGSGTERRTHNLEKTSNSEIVKGEMGLTWKTQVKDVKSFIGTCGICLRFRRLLCRPPLGKTLFRVHKDIQPFTHISLDPVGGIRVQGKGMQTAKIYPIVGVCLASGAAHIEIIQGLESRDIYLALLRIQYRYNTRVHQVFTDKGSQLSGNILGEKRSFYQRSLKKLWAFHNNTGYGQFRNIAEMKIKILKKMIRQGIFGLPGPQQEAVDRTLVETAIQAGVNMVNNTPFQPFGLNQTLLCPADLVNPWRVASIHGPPRVQELPETGLQTLVEAKRVMTIKQDKMSEILWEETHGEVERFKPGNLKLGKNKSQPSTQVTVGGIVMAELGGRPPCLGVIVGATQRDAQVRFKRGTRTVPLGQCAPIAESDNMTSGSRMGESFTHFLSVEFDHHSKDYHTFTTKVKAMQELLGDVPEVGKPVKSKALHLTIGVLHAAEEEIPDLIEKTKRVWDEFVDILGSPSNLILSFKGLGFGSGSESGNFGTIWVKLGLGEKAILVLREMIEDQLGGNLTDLNFQAHLTIFKSSKLSEEVQQGIQASTSGINLGCSTIRKISLRPRKVGKEMPKPVLVLQFPGNCNDE